VTQQQCADIEEMRAEFSRKCLDITTQLERQNTEAHGRFRSMVTYVAKQLGESITCQNAHLIDRCKQMLSEREHALQLGSKNANDGAASGPAVMSAVSTSVSDDSKPTSATKESQVCLPEPGVTSTVGALVASSAAQLYTVTCTQSSTDCSMRPAKLPCMSTSSLPLASSSMITSTANTMVPTSNALSALSTAVRTGEQNIKGSDVVPCSELLDCLSQLNHKIKSLVTDHYSHDGSGEHVQPQSATTEGQASMKSTTGEGVATSASKGDTAEAHTPPNQQPASAGVQNHKQSVMRPKEMTGRAY